VQTLNFILSRLTNSTRAAFALRILPVLLVLTMLPLTAVRGGVTFEPISLSSSTTFEPGSPLPCTVQLDGGPQNITIYSNPVGVVSYQGVISQSETVQATTNASASAGYVTVYVVTDGQVVRSALTRAVRSFGND